MLNDCVPLGLSFRAVRFREGTPATDKLFTGQRLDGTGLYYFHARYYDAQLGRFISPDTVVPNWTDPQSFNRYSYCRNNPLKYIDPSGHQMEPERVSVDANGNRWGMITITIDGQEVPYWYPIDNPARDESGSAAGVTAVGDTRVVHDDGGAVVYWVDLKAMSALFSYIKLPSPSAGGPSASGPQWVKRAGCRDGGCSAEIGLVKKSEQHSLTATAFHAEAGISRNGANLDANLIESEWRLHR